MGHSALHHFNKWPRALGNIFACYRGTDQNGDFKALCLCHSFLPCLLPFVSPSPCSPSLTLSLFPLPSSVAMSVWVSALNRIDSLCALKDGYIRGPVGLAPSSMTLTFCLSPLKRPSHPLHSLIGHCHREKKNAKEPP